MKMQKCRKKSENSKGKRARGAINPIYLSEHNFLFRAKKDKNV